MSPTPFADPATADQLVSQIGLESGVSQTQRRLTPRVPHPESSSDPRNGRYAPERLGSLDLVRAVSPSHVSARSEQRVSIAQTAIRLVVWCVYHPYCRRHEHVLVDAAPRTGSSRRESPSPLLACHPAGNVRLIVLKGLSRLPEQSTGSFYDNLSALGWSPGSRIRAASIATPAPVYLADYPFPKRSLSPAHRLPRLQGNPLAPLRKRLARALAATGRGRRLHTEVQLLLELVEALDACVASLAHPLEAEAVPPDRQLRASTSMLPVAPAQLASPSRWGDAPGHSSATPRLVAVDEVRLLVQELVELIPDAQRCLREGAYGPLTQSDVTTDVLLQSLEDPDPTTDGASSSPVTPTSPLRKLDSWPARLARDCRALLEEAGLPSTASGANAAAWLQFAAAGPPAEDGQPAGLEQDSSQFAGSP